MTDPFLILLVGMIIVIGGIIGLRLHAFLALLLGAFAVGLLTPAAAVEQFAIETGMNPEQVAALVQRDIGSRIAMAFGNTTAQIGILIAMAAIIGKSMLDSGAAERIVRSILRVTGVKRAPVAFVSSSFLLSIPVFFDTVFYLMIPLAKAMAARLKKNYLLFVLTIAAGATMTHSLVPPTPGPLFLVSELQIPIHMMLIGGMIVGFFTVSVGFLFALWANRKWSIPLRDSPDAPLQELETLTEIDTGKLPPLWLALLPILFPVAFITIRGILETVIPANGFLSGIAVFEHLIALVFFFGERNMALITGGLIALFVVVRQKRTDKIALASSMQTALMSGGVIILITAAGGAFGAMLQQTGISMRIASLTEGYQMALIPLAFFSTAIIRTAQGSATVSMITAAGILSGLTHTVELDYHVLYLGLAIACGSKPVPWMNDSGFWIICKMSNLTEKETLKTISTMFTLMGLVGLMIVWIGAKLFPLV